MSENESFRPAMPDSVPYSLGTQNARIGGLGNRVEALERTTERLAQDVTGVKETLATINQRLETIEKGNQKISQQVDKLQEGAAEYRGYWRGVGHSVKVGQWAGSILFTVIGGLLMFLVNKVFLGN